MLIENGIRCFQSNCLSEIAQGRQIGSDEGSCAGVGRDLDPRLAHDGSKPSLPSGAGHPD